MLPSRVQMVLETNGAFANHHHHKPSGTPMEDAADDLRGEGATTGAATGVGALTTAAGMFSGATP